MVSNNHKGKGMNKLDKIEKQVERWDRAAKVFPVLFAIFATGIYLSGICSFETIFKIAFISFCITAVIWWFWTIYSIRQLTVFLNKAGDSLQDVRSDFVIISKEISEIKKLHLDSVNK
jgi:hypothetical protein